MTNLVYFNPIYSRYVERPGIISNLELPIIQSLIESCLPSDLFVVSTYIEKDSVLIDLIKKSPKRAIIYSGMDWNDPIVRKDAHDFIKENVGEVIYIGNVPGEGYFSYWLFFIEQFFKKYSIDQITPQKIDYLYMSLNRKRHIHRVNLVEKLENNDLLQFGLVSLGGDNMHSIPPILLEEDIINEEGDYIAANKTQGITNDINSLGNLRHWNNHLINITTETTVHSDTFISEKTWKPIIGLRPFIIVGDVKIYSYLKDYGIDTFDDLFGTGYLEPNFSLRIDWAVDILKQFKDVNYLDFYKSIYPRLLYNRERMKKIFYINDNRFNSVKDLLKNG